MNCTRCGRHLKNPSPTGMGPRCALAVLGAKPRRSLFDPKPRKSDPRQDDMFAVERACSELIVGISLEMPA